MPKPPSAPRKASPKPPTFGRASGPPKPLGGVRPRELGPGQPFACNDPLRGRQVAGDAYAGKVLGCATAPTGQRGPQVVIGELVPRRTLQRDLAAKARRRWQGDAPRLESPRGRSRPELEERRSVIPVGTLHVHTPPAVTARYDNRPSSVPPYDLVIAHSAEEGTTIQTFPKGERKWNAAIKGLHNAFKWWDEGQRWYRQQSRGRAEPTVRLESLAIRLRDSGARVLVEEVVPVSEREAADIRRQHLSERADRLSDRASAKAGAASALVKQGHQLAERIPFGQPIHVGHHSETSDRNFRARVHTTLAKGYEAVEHAQSLAERAERTERAADRLSPEFMDAQARSNAYVEALQAILSKRLKKDANAETVRSQRGAAKTLRVGVVVRYPSAANMPYSEVDIRSESVAIIRVGNRTTATLDLRGKTPEQAYAAVLDVLPKGPREGEVADLRSRDNPFVFGEAFVDYAAKRLRRALGAGTVNRSAFMRKADPTRHWPRLWVEMSPLEVWNVYVDGSVLVLVREVRKSPQSFSTTDSRLWEHDVSDLTVPAAYDAMLAAMQPHIERARLTPDRQQA